MAEKIVALIGCQNDDCAADASFYLDDMRLYQGKPICENCYDDISLSNMTEEEYDARNWVGLPRISLKDLSAR